MSDAADAKLPVGRAESYGQRGLTPVDRFGQWLSTRAIRRALAGMSRPAVLDLGCGYDATLLRQVVATTGGTGVGVDVAVDATCAAPSIALIADRVETALPRLIDEGRRFDVVLLMSVLEHLREPAAALAACYRLLRPGGVLLVNVPNWRGKAFLEFSAFRLAWSPADEMNDHKMYYDKRDLWPLLVAAGFRPQEVRLRYHKFRLNLFALARREA